MFARAKMGTAKGDIYWNNVSLLLHLDSDFSDQTGKCTVTNTNGTISSTQSKFGGASANFNKTAYVVATNNTGLQFGTGDFTIEGWIYLSTKESTGNVLFSKRANPAGAKGLVLYIDPTTGYVEVRAGDSNTVDSWNVVISSGSVLSLTTWHHLAVCRSSNNYYAFVDGNQIGSTVNWSGTLDSDSYNLWIGYSDGTASGLNGYIDEFRVTKGVARYTSNFTPSGSAFPNS